MEVWQGVRCDDGYHCIVRGMEGGGGGNVKMISHACPSCRRAGLVACVVGVFGWVVFPKQVVWKCVPHTYKKNRV